MSRVMTGQGFGPPSGVRGLRTDGQEGHRGTVPRHRGTTVLDLLELPDGSAPCRAVLDPAWLTDLHDPTLVITPGYVGPDRRRSDRTWDGAPAAPDRRARLIRRAIQVLVTTVAVVVPLVLIASPAAPPALATRPPAGSSVSSPTAGHVHRALRGNRALSPRSARVGAAGRRALARSGATAAAVAGVPAATTSTTPAPAAPSARAVARVEARARIVQARAATRAAASRRRAVRAATRAAAGATNPSPHGGRGATAPVG
jgi:hypothetical protein